MKDILTQDEARVFDLPRSPFARHRRVAEYLKGLHAAGTEVSLSFLGNKVTINGETINCIPSGPVLGRTALKHIAEAANTVEYFHGYGLRTGETS